MAQNDWRDLSALVVGFGSIGRRHARVLNEIGVRDVRVAEPSDDLRRQAATEHGISSLSGSLEEGLRTQPDTVFICTPTAMHIPQALAAIASGADVFVEKPLSVSLERIEELKVTARDAGQLVMVGHCFRFHEGLSAAYQWLKDGAIGRLVSIRCVMGEYIPERIPNYRNMYLYSYSGVYELMHEIDLALWFARQEPAEVMGLQGNFSDIDLGAPDLVEMIIRFEDRCVASVHLDFFERMRHRQTELLGTDGTILVEFAEWDRCGLWLHQAGSDSWRHEELVTDRDDMFRAEDRAFLESVAGRMHPPVDIDEGRRAVEVMLACQQSSRESKSVSMPMSILR